MLVTIICLKDGSVVKSALLSDDSTKEEVTEEWAWRSKHSHRGGSHHYKEEATEE